MNIGNVANKKKALTVTFPEAPGEELHVRYNSALYTPEYLDKLPENEADANIADVSRQLVELLVDWDLTEGEPGKEVKVPITTEQLKKVPIGILAQVLRSVVEDMFPNRTRSERSGSF